MGVQGWQNTDTVLTLKEDKIKGNFFAWEAGKKEGHEEFS